jgi:hypothetical protein
MCFAATGWLQGEAEKLLLVRWQSWCYGRRVTANGSAIKGGCVTRRKHRPGPGTLARK